MKVSKVVQEFATANNLQAVSSVFPYKFRGFENKRLKDLYLVKTNGSIVARFERRYSKCVKWYLGEGKTKSGNRNFYRITETVLNDLIWDSCPLKLR